MLAGVARKSGRGIPSCLYQEEKTKKDEVAEAKWTLRVATLKGDPEIQKMVAFSLYDSKPFYFLSNSCSSVRWDKKHRLVYHKDRKKMVSVPFHRLNIIDEYNMNMNSVDLADQLRGVYRWDEFMRKRKWWWSIMLWCMQMLQTNAYVCYKKYMNMHDKETISHYEFNKQIALAWLDPYNNWNKARMNLCAKIAEEEKKRAKDSPSKRMTTRSISSRKPKRKRATRFTDKALCPTSGSLNCRLVQVQHWPLMEGITEAASCQLHRWASGEIQRKRGGNLFKCSYCEITLCGKCFTAFHTVVDLVGEKNKLALEYGKYDESDDE